MNQYLLDEQLMNELFQFIQQKANYLEGVNLINRLSNLEEISIKNDPQYKPAGFDLPNTNTKVKKK